MAGKRLIVVPNGEIRSLTVNEKHDQFATIYSGKYPVVGEVGEEGKIRVPRAVFDEQFEVFDPEPEPSEV